MLGQLQQAVELVVEAEKIADTNIVIAQRTGDATKAKTFNAIEDALQEARRAIRKARRLAESVWE